MNLFFFFFKCVYNNTLNANYDIIKRETYTHTHADTHTNVHTREILHKKSSAFLSSQNTVGLGNKENDQLQEITHCATRSTI